MIRAVFRVQCDGPGKEWLRKGRVMPSHWHESYAETFPDEPAARRAAIGAGWTERVAGAWLCPACALNPLGIVLPEPQCTSVSPDPLGRLQCARTHGHDDEHRAGLVDWF